jgi:DNA-binding response OmpR family regulator
MLTPPNVPGRIVRVLLVDDDTELGELVREYLAREGFSLEVDADETRAVERALSGDYRLIVLDVMLPDETHVK